MELLRAWDMDGRPSHPGGLSRLGIRGELYYLHGCAVLCQAAARGAAARRKAAARELQQATGYEPREAKHADLNITSVGGGRVALSIRAR